MVISDKRGENDGMKNPLKYLKAPCSRCPYKLGLARTFVNPCPQCRENGYSMFEQFQRRNAPFPPREKG